MRSPPGVLALVAAGGIWSSTAFAQDAPAQDDAASAPAAAPAVEPAPAGTTAPVEAAAAAPSRSEPPASPAAPACAETAALCVSNGSFAFWPRVRIRTGYEFVTPDEQLLFIGKNDGFFADQMRVGFDGAFKDRVRFRFILDATSLMPGTVNATVTPTLAALRDAWVAWSPSPWLVLSAGQQFMPSDIEGTTTIVMLPFSRRSVATGGVRAGQGIAVTGLSPTRQLGVVVGTGGPWAGPGPRVGTFSLEYKLGISNGNGQNLLGNDNKLPALYGRVGAGFEDMVLVGLGGRLNPRTVGAAPNLYAETDALGFVDVTVRAAGIELVAQGIARATSLDTVFPEGLPDGSDVDGQETGVGGTAWIWLKRPFGLDLSGVQPAYRISYFDPSSAFDTDTLLENSVGVRWDIPMDALRLSLFVDYTVLTELGDGVRDLQNDRFSTLLQLEL